MVAAPQIDNRPFLYGNCDVCPIDCKPVRGYGVGENIVVIGESPGPQEVYKGRPFIGPSGNLLRETFRSLGVDPEDDVYYTNAILCHSDTKPPKDAIVACNNRLKDVELEMVRPKKILVVGAAASQAILSPSKAVAISKVRGRGYLYEYNGGIAYAVPTWHPAAVLRIPEYFRDFVSDIHKLLNNTTPDFEELEVKVAWNEADALAYLEEVWNYEVASCDIETTGFNLKSDVILSVGFGILTNAHAGVSFILPTYLLYKSTTIRDAVKQILKEHPCIVFHNQKFDLGFLGRDLATSFKGNNLVDSMLLHYVLDERSAGDQGTGGRNIGRVKVHSLKDLARIYCDAYDYAYIKEFLKLTDPDIDDFKKLFYYQGQDCYYTIRIYNRLKARIDNDVSFRGMSLLNSLLLPAAKALSEIERHGMLVDREYLETFAQEKADVANVVFNRLQDTVRTATGICGFNPNSPTQVVELVYNIWGMPHLKDPLRKHNPVPVTKLVLEQLAALTDDDTQKSILLDIIDWRGQSKLFTTYAIGLLKAIRKDGRIQPSFSLHGTTTGRLSSSSPNTQNIPNKIGPAVEWAFIAPEGYTLALVDFSQLELRVMAFLSRDEAMMDVFHRGGDIHGETSVKLFHKPVERVSKLERTLTKTLVFGILYGQGPESIVKGASLSHLVAELGETPWTIEEAQEFQQQLMSAYPRVREWIKEQHNKAFVQHYVETATGRRRRFPLILPQTRGDVKRQAANSPVQGLASDICLNALVKLHYTLPEGAFILNTVHDAILFEIRNDILKPTIKHIIDSMENDPPITMDVPLKVEVKLGPRWGNVTTIDGASL